MEYPNLPLAETFFQKCTQLASRWQVLGSESITEKKSLVFVCYLHTLKIHLVYRHGGNIPPSQMLFCRIFLHKNDPIPYQLPELLAELQIPEFHALYFSNIQTQQQMACCFDSLIETLDRWLPKLKKASEDGALCRQCREHQLEIFQRLYSVSEKDLLDDPTTLHRLLENYENLAYLLHFGENSPYQAYLSGRYQKASRQYHRLIQKNKALPYEQQLTHWIDSLIGSHTTFSAISPECAPATLHRFGETLLWGSLYFLSTVAALLPLFFLLYWLGVFVFSPPDSLYVAAMPWYAVLLFTALPSVFGAIALRRVWIRLYRKKKSAVLLEADFIEIRPWLHRFVLGFFFLTLVGCLYITTTVSAMKICFSPKTLTYYQEECYRFDLSGKTFSYQDVDAIYRVEGRYNDFGDWIDRGSYLLVFEDGTVLDLDGYLSTEETETHILPILVPYQIPIKSIHSQNDL